MAEQFGRTLDGESETDPPSRRAIPLAEPLGPDCRRMDHLNCRQAPGIRVEPTRA